MYFALAVLLVVALIFATVGARNLYPDLGLAIRIVTISIGLFVLAAVGCKMASNAGSKRPPQPNALALANPQDQTLWAKWPRGISHYCRAFIMLFMLFLITCAYVDVNPLAWVILPLMFLAQVWMFGNIGLFLSLRIRPANLAIRFLLGALFGIIAIASTLSYSYHNFGPEGYVDRRIELLQFHKYTEFDDWANPPQSWWHLFRPNQRYYFSRYLACECMHYCAAIFVHCCIGTYFALLATRLVPRPKASK